MTKEKADVEQLLVDNELAQFAAEYWARQTARYIEMVKRLEFEVATLKHCYEPAGEGEDDG